MQFWVVFLIEGHPPVGLRFEEVADGVSWVLRDEAIEACQGFVELKIVIVAHAEPDVPVARTVGLTFVPKSQRSWLTLLGINPLAKEE